MSDLESSSGDELARGAGMTRPGDAELHALIDDAPFIAGEDLAGIVEMAAEALEKADTSLDTALDRNRGH